MVLSQRIEISSLPVSISNEWAAPLMPRAEASAIAIVCRRNPALHALGVDRTFMRLPPFEIFLTNRTTAESLATPLWGGRRHALPSILDSLIDRHRVPQGSAAQ